MYADLFNSVAPILFCALVGFVWAKRGLPFSSDFVGSLVMNVSAPCLIVSTLTQVELSHSTLQTMAAATFAVLVGTALLSAVAVYWSRVEFRAYFPSLVFTNTGNIGLPLCMFAFGEQGLALGLAFFMLYSIAHFSAGVVIMSGEPVLKQLFTNPILYAIAITLLLILTGWQLPQALQRSVNLLGGIAIPLMLVALGVSLSQLQVKTAGRALQFALYRLLIGFSVGLAVIYGLQLDGPMAGVILIQASMPVAVFNYLLALRYQRSPEQVASFVVMSTLLSFVTLPLLVWLAKYA